MSRTVSIDEMADAINEGLKEYATLASTEVKKAVRKSAKTVKDQISANAPLTRQSKKHDIRQGFGSANFT